MIKINYTPMQIPEKLTVEFLEDHVYEKDWIEHVKDHYLEIMEQFGESDLIYVCNALAFTLLHNQEGSEKTKETYRIDRIVIDICRIGTNLIMEPSEQLTSDQNTISHADYMSYLYGYMAIAMMNCGRPISAFGYLDIAESMANLFSEVAENSSDDVHEMKVQYENLRAKEAEFYLRVIEDLPTVYRPIYSTSAYCYLTHAIVNLEELGEHDLAIYYTTYLKRAGYSTVIYPIEKSQIDKMNGGKIVDEYTNWCHNNVRFLTMFNEIPNFNEDLAKDDIYFDLNERYQWLMDDILHTYDHCRRIIYNTEKAIIDDVDTKDRDEDVESLLDCYTRLYTLLDKTSKIIKYLFPRDGVEDKQHFYDVAECYVDSSNEYLKAIFHICQDIFPNRNDTASRTADPRSNIAGIITRPGFIRNNIIHNTVKICKEKDDREFYEGVVTISPKELLHHTNVMFHNIRELLLTLQLAVERDKQYR